MVDAHQSEQPARLGLVGHQRDQHASQTDRLGRQIDPAAVALVVDQIDDRQDRCEPVRQEMIRGDRKRDPGVADL